MLDARAKGCDFDACNLATGLMSARGHSRRINETAGMSARHQIAAVSLRCSELALRKTGLSRCKKDWETGQT
jgi:hypothetical protein